MYVDRVTAQVYIRAQVLTTLRICLVPREFDCSGVDYMRDRRTLTKFSVLAEFVLENALQILPYPVNVLTLEAPIILECNLQIPVLMVGDVYGVKLDFQDEDAGLEGEPSLPFRRDLAERH